MMALQCHLQAAFNVPVIPKWKTVSQAAVSTSAFFTQKHKKLSQYFNLIMKVRSARRLEDSCPCFLVTVSLFAVR